MTYVTANLHGCYSKFTEMLRHIKFKDTDVMYVLGDIVDCGPEPVELVLDLSMRYNIYAVAGEHDYTAARMLSGFDRMLRRGETPDAAFISEMNAWVEDGGKSTLDGFRKLDKEMREGVIDYLSDMLLYEETKVGGRTYLLVHAGLGSLADGGNDPNPEEMFDSPVDFLTCAVEGKTVIAGHIPTGEIPGSSAGTIFRSKGCIAVDCGAARGGRLGCLRLEDGREFYV